MSDQRKNLPVSEEQQPAAPKTDPPIKPARKQSVVIYLTILFAAAFLLLLMAYFMQQRNNEAIIGNLQDSVNQFHTLDELREEVEALQSELASLKGQQEATETELDTLRQRYEQLEDSYAAAVEESGLLAALFEAQALLNEGDYSGAARCLTSIEDLPEMVRRYDAGIQHHNASGTLLQPRYDALVAALVEESVLQQAEDGSLSLADTSG